MGSVQRGPKRPESRSESTKKKSPSLRGCYLGTTMEPVQKESNKRAVHIRDRSRTRKEGVDKREFQSM